MAELSPNLTMSLSPKTRPGPEIEKEYKILSNGGSKKGDSQPDHHFFLQKYRLAIIPKLTMATNMPVEKDLHVLLKVLSKK